MVVESSNGVLSVCCVPGCFALQLIADPCKIGLTVPGLSWETEVQGCPSGSGEASMQILV